MALGNKTLRDMVSELAVPWEEDQPPEKRRYYVHDIRGGSGKSGMGIVYLALDKEDDEVPVAIKTFQNKFLESPRAIEQFKIEAEVWVELGKHKNIVRAFYVRTHLGRPYVFMEWIVGNEQYGPDLSGWIKLKGLDLALIVNFAIQFCRGMAHAEKRFKEMGRVFIHRDIKPENIMVTKDKMVKVTDFGLVHAVKDETFAPEAIGGEEHGRLTVLSQNRICGTPFYMSPEQVLQGAEELKRRGVLKKDVEVPPLDVRSDMCAFGCVLYAMVRGEPPFWRPPFAFQWDRYFYETLYEEPAPVSSGDREFDELIMQCLRKRPEQRGLGSFSELEKTLQEIHARLTGTRLKEEAREEIEAWELVNRGYSYIELGRYERAIEYCDKAIELSPRDFEAYNNRGVAYANLGQPERAIKDYSEAVKLNPNHASAYNNRAALYDDLGQPERAIGDYSKAIELDPRSAEAYNNRGNSYNRIGKPERAIRDYSTAIEMNPKYVKAYYSRGATFITLGLYEPAMEDCNKAIELNQKEPKAYNNRANIYIHLGQYKQAVEDCDKAIQLNPSYVEAYANRGRAYAMIGQYELAIEDFRQSIDFAPPQYGEHVARVKELVARLEEELRGK